MIKKISPTQKILMLLMSFSLVFNPLFWPVLQVNAQGSGVGKLPAVGEADMATSDGAGVGGGAGNGGNTVTPPAEGGMPVVDAGANETLYNILMAITGVDYSSGLTAGNTGVTAAQTTAMTTKEFVEDVVVWGTINAALRQLTSQTINWINSGFEGSPLYIEDLEQFLMNQGNVIAEGFLTEYGSKINMPFSTDIEIALGENRNSSFIERMTPTLNREEYSKFTGGENDSFSGGGGWNTWYELTQNPANNPMESYLAAKSEMESRVANNEQIQKEQLDWGQGFLSWRECEERSGASYSESSSEDGDGNITYSSSATPGQGDCSKWGPVQTPGSVIKDQLNEHLSTGLKRTEIATELGQIVDAFLNQLATKALSGEGLSGNGGGGGSSGMSGNSFGNLGDFLNPEQFAQQTSDAECSSQNDAIEKIKSIIGPLMSNMSQQKPQAAKFDPQQIFTIVMVLGTSLIQDIKERQEGNPNPTNLQEAIKSELMKLAGSFMGGQLITDTFGKEFNKSTNPKCKNFNGETSNTTDIGGITTIPILSLNGDINITIYPTEKLFVDPGVTLIDEEAGGAFDWLDAQELIKVNDAPYDSTANYVDTSTVGTYFITYTYKNEKTGLSANPQIRVVNVAQNKVPIVTILGNNIMYVLQNTPFSDPGVTALDYLGSDITNAVNKKIYDSTGKLLKDVDTSKVGAYVIFYNVVSEVDGRKLENPQTYRIVLVTDSIN